MEKSVTSWCKLQSWDSVYSADSVEFCPVSPYRHVFLCGTYQLTDTNTTEKASLEKRKGSIMLFTLNQSDNTMQLIRTIHTPAILDMKWSHHKVQDKILFATVNAIGQLIVYELMCSADDFQDLNIQHLCSYQLETPEGADEILALSLDWSTRKHASSTESMSPTQIIVSDSQGFLHLFELMSGGLILVQSWKGHGFEAWIAAFNYETPDVFYSGGDDCLMKLYDVRQNTSTQTIREHEAGVTSIQYNPFRPNALASGSYDENVYIWDDRHLKSSSKKTHLGGGVWRIKHQAANSILTATMYNGFHCINCITGEETRTPDNCGESEVKSSDGILHYSEHGSIAYGIDSCYDNPSYVVTCSFYNHLIHLSRLQTEHNEESISP